VQREKATVYVGNLPWRTTEDDLAQLFRDVGPVVDARIIQDPISGRSRGYGFVELARAEDAARAVEQLDGKEFNGRVLIVSAAHPKPQRY
jgi:cold-inducible RNA-binding protein